MKNIGAKHQETTMKTSDLKKQLTGSARTWMGWWALAAMACAWSAIGSSYSWSGEYAPDSWEGLGNDPSAYYVFLPQAGEATLLHIAGAVVQGPSVTTVRLKNGVSVPDDNFRFDYSVSYGQAEPTSMVATFQIRDSADQIKENVVLTSFGLSGSMGPFVLAAGDRVYFILDSTLSGGKFSPAYLQITPVPEPAELGIAVCAALALYGWCRRQRPSVPHLHPQSGKPHRNESFDCL